ncbi:lipopolysaccharide biosynthesis protein [Photobacterium sp. DNB22_13_2]
MKNKQLLSNILSFGSSDIITMLIPIITMPILTRTIGTSGYGIYIFYSTVIIFGHTIIDFSSNLVGVRDISQSDQKKQSINAIYNQYQLIRLILLMLYLIAISFALKLMDYEEVNNVITFSSIYLLGYYILSPWFLHATGKAKYYAVTTVLSKLCFLVVVVLFVRSPDDLHLLFISSSLPFLILSCVVLFKIKKKYKLSFIRLTFKDTKDKFIEGNSTFIGILAPNLYNNIPILILGSIIPQSSFALFGVANRLSALALTAQNVITKAAYPLIFKQNKSQLKNLIISNLSICTVFTTVILLFGEKIIDIFLGSHFTDSYFYLLILLPSIFFAGIANSIVYGHLLPNKKDKAYRKISISTSLISAVVGIILIYNYQATGVALLILFARGLLALGFTLEVNKTGKDA